MRRTRVALRSVTTGLTILVLAAACSSGGGSGDGDAGGPTTTAAPAGFTVLDQSDGQLEVATGAFRVRIFLDPFRMDAAGGDGSAAVENRASFFVEGDGLYVVRGGEEVGVERARVRHLGADAVELGVRFADGGRGAVTLTAETAGTVGVELRAHDAGDVTAWGERLDLSPREQIYGLTERINSDLIDSEVVPTDEGTLNRVGEVVTMSVTPTISAYAPFYQSSAGYGLLVDGTMQGTYDVGATEPDRLQFEFAAEPGAGGGRFFLFHGPDGPAILDGYTALTGRPPTAPDVVFRHWRGRDEIPPGEPVEVDGVAMNPTVAAEIQEYDERGLSSPGVYHFDRPWATGPEGYGALAFDPERFPNAADMLRVLHDRGWHPTVWISNWAIGARGEEARRLGYLAPGSDRAIDFTNPDAAAWFRDDLRAFLEGPEGRYVDGLFLDRSDEPDVPGEASDVYADGRTGAEVHNAYPVLFQQNVRQVLDEVRPDAGFAIARAAYTGTAGLVMTWGGDTHSRDGFQIPETPATGPSTDLGLRSVLVSIQRAAYLGLGLWGSDIGGYSEFADREVFARWIEVGAASPLMRFHGKGTDLPWEMPTTPRDDTAMTEIYRRYTDLHDGLAPYLADLAAEEHETGLTPVRPLAFAWPEEPDALDRWDEWLLGDDLLVAPVWQSGAREREVWFPPGRWVDWWDHDVVVEGPATRTVEAPLDTLPLYAAEGSDLLG